MAAAPSDRLPILRVLVAVTNPNILAALCKLFIASIGATAVA
jgi:hypothetical protein